MFPVLLDLSFENNKIMVIDNEYNANNVITFFLEKEGYNVDSLVILLKHCILIEKIDMI